MGRISGRIMVLRAIHHRGDLRRHGVQLHKVADKQFCSSTLVSLPPCQSLHGSQVCEYPVVVEFIQVSLIDSNDVIASSTDILREEIGVDAVAGAESQLFGDDS